MLNLKRNMKKWQNHKFSSGTINGDDFIEFLKDSKSDLKAMCKEHELKVYAFNKNHYCFSAVLTDGEKFVYISQSDVRWSDPDRILIRSMKGPRDYTGGMNQYCSWEDVGEKAVEIINYLKKREAMSNAR